MRINHARKNTFASTKNTLSHRFWPALPIPVMRSVRRAGLCRSNHKDSAITKPKNRMRKHHPANQRMVPALANRMSAKTMNMPEICTASVFTLVRWPGRFENLPLVRGERPFRGWVIHALHLAFVRGQPALEVLDVAAEITG